MRNIVAAASVVPQVAFKSILKVETQTTTEEEERALEAELNVPPREMETLYAKISAAIHNIATGSIAADLTILAEQYLERIGEALPGRRKLRVIYRHYRTDARKDGLYSFAGLQAVQLHGDNLENFLRLWETL